jgi:hypothetical protein
MPFALDIHDSVLMPNHHSLLLVRCPVIGDHIALEGENFGTGTECWNTRARPRARSFATGTSVYHHFTDQATHYLCAGFQNRSSGSDIFYVNTTVAVNQVIKVIPFLTLRLYSAFAALHASHVGSPRRISA